MRACVSVIVLLLLCCWLVAQERASDKSAFAMSMEEKELVELTNKERAKEKLPALKPAPKLFETARAHSKNMAKQEKMEHILDGNTPFQRIKATGYRYRIAGENIACGDLPLPDVMKGWMASKPHRENILNPKYTEIGVARAPDGKGNFYYTQVFATPQKP